MLALSLFEEIDPFLSPDVDAAHRVFNRSAARERRQIRSAAVRSLLCLAALLAGVAAMDTACQPRAITPPSVAR